MQDLTPGEQSDRDLLARIGARDREAMRALHGLYYRRIARFLGRITTRRELVDEMVNDTFMVVWETAHAFRGEARISTWILGIAYRRGVTSIRSETRAEGNMRGALPESAAWSECTEQVETVDWLGHALRALPVEQRAAVELCYQQGFSCEEIGELMGCPPSTVKTRMFHARRKLRIALRTSDGSMSSPQPSALRGSAVRSVHP